MTVATKVIPVVHDKDPKTVINDALKGLVKGNLQPTAGDVLLCVYQRPAKMKSGLYMPDTASRLAEDKHQGVVGLIVALGPDFAKHKRALALDKMPEVGDWVFFNNRDCHAFTLGDQPMRLLQGDFIRMIITDPDSVI